MMSLPDREAAGARERNWWRESMHMRATPMHHPKRRCHPTEEWSGHGYAHKARSVAP